MIIIACILAIAACSALALLKGLRPTAGLPYESVTMEQAIEYMEYEEGYILLDVGTGEEYTACHIAGALSVPYDSLVSQAAAVLPDKDRMIYVYDRDDDREDRACRKLSELGYTNITAIGRMSDWTGDFEGTDV